VGADPGETGEVGDFQSLVSKRESGAVRRGPKMYPGAKNRKDLRGIQVEKRNAKVCVKQFLETV